MKQKWAILLLVFGMMLSLTASNLEADFIQCTAEGACTGTTVGDIINGNPSHNVISGLDGNDTIFAGDSPSSPCFSVIGKEAVGGLMFGGARCNNVNLPEHLDGGPGNDFLSGGPGSDELFGNPGNDVLLPGPDQYPYA